MIVVDHPGGRMDRIVADPDVTTFFNDRFHAVFLQASAEQADGTIRFYDGCGCALTEPLRPASPEELIALANHVIVRPGARRCEGRRFSFACTVE